MKIQQNFHQSLWQKKFRMKHIAEEIIWFKESCLKSVKDVICKGEFREDESVEECWD